MPSHRNFALGTVAAALISILYFYIASKADIEIDTRSSKVSGSNNTVLFLAHSEHGAGNIFAATSYALMKNHPEVDNHYASFNAAAIKIDQISKFAKQQAPAAKPITFHPLQGVPFMQAISDQGFDISSFMSKPGIMGLGGLRQSIDLSLHPWSPSEHIKLTDQIIKVIEKVDPAIIVVDLIFKPAIDAIYRTNRRYVVISPNALQENIAMLQPYGAGLWKYPSMATGYPYPLPWYLIPANIYAIGNQIYALLAGPQGSKLNKHLKERGLNSISVPELHQSFGNDTWFISQSLREAEYPYEFIPSYVLVAGPIYLSSAPASEQDPELTAWTSRAPTILINLGSHATYNEQKARAIAQAIGIVIMKYDVHVLWKFKKTSDYSDDFLGDLREAIASKQVRLEPWLSVEPPALLETGNIILSVHHGGANSFFETVANGVPHIILPLWADCYDFARRAKWLGIGIWANEFSGVELSGEEIGKAMIAILDDRKGAGVIQRNVDRLYEIAKKRQGRDVAADKIASLACLPLAITQT